uniref:fimbrial tip adhesin FimD n=1 Tax=Phocaeicola sp. TaxID=2773926 RepID=UPI003FF14EA0
MKLRIYTIACTVLVALGCLCACQEDFDNGPLAGDENTWVLNLEATAVQPSRSPGVDEYNENKVTSADVFFFNDAGGQCIYAQTGLEPVGNELRVKLADTAVSFGRSYYIYVIANGRAYYADVDDAVGMTIAELQAKRIQTTWKDGYKSNGEIEESLLMDGEASVTVSRETPGMVSLKRAMAKVALFPTVTTEPIVENGVEYTPIVNAMSVTMVYGVQATNLAGDYEVAAEDYVTRMHRAYTQDGTKHVPFYSYPNLLTTTDRKDSYLILCVPWNMKTDAGTEPVNYYYRVPITGSEDTPALLERNKYYKVNVNVSVLGSMNPREAVTLNADFIIYDWFDMDISADMNNYKYLVLEEYTSVMNNTNELRMPYVSSSALTMGKTQITKVTYPNYNSDTQGSHTSTVTLDTPEEIQSEGFSLTWNDDELIFTHPVTTEDYVPDTITVEVWNDEGLDATWKIIQYPAIYIVGDYNKNGANNRFVYGESSGSVYDDDNNSLGGVNNPSTSSSSNSNLNQYTIYITSFDIEGSEYAIGDPRSSSVNNLSFLSEKSDSKGKKLTHYYPSRQTEVDNVIAPAFKIASSWGVTYDISYAEAQRRCASYQENGYPAGRWRVPTEAEIEYIVSLSNRGVIPALFNGQYFASSGRYYDNGYHENGWGGSYIDPSAIGFHDSNGNDYAVRCVYDVWYWGNEKMSEKGGSDTQFVWGDEPMQ